MASYGDYLAVFNTSAPDDMDEEWGCSQFPRCVFKLNMQADAERKISGRLYIDVMCENDTESVRPEELEAIVRSAVDGCFFSTPEMTISAQWSTSEDFTEKDSKVAGFTLIFDVLAYPVQETEYPDPVLAVNLWMITLYPDAYVIGIDDLPEAWKPSYESPALYCRLSGLSESPRMKSTAAVTWIGADMKVNVMAPCERVRSIISKTLFRF